MGWFKAMLSSRTENLKPPENMDSMEEKRWRMSLLSAEEREVFDWFRRGYTARWTAETMLLDNRAAKQLFGSVYRKLGVNSDAEVSRVYRTEKLTPDEMLPEQDIKSDSQ